MNAMPSAALRISSSFPTSHQGVVLGALAGVLGCAGLASTANAQASSSYSVSHTFSYTPAGNVVDVRAFQYEHAWLVVDSVPGEDHFPLAQDPNFDAYGTDSFLLTGLAENSGLLGPVPALYQVSVIPAAGTGGPVTHCTTVNIPPSVATACTSVDILPFVVLPGSFQIDGKIGSSGGVTADLFGRGVATAYAFSNTAIRIVGGNLMANGTIQWNPNFFFDAVGANASETLVQDPIVFEVSNLTTGVNTTFDLLHIDASIDGDGLVNWAPAGITIDAQDAEVTASIPATLVAPGQGGKLEIIVQGGLVTSSFGTGIFALSAPPIGSPVPLTTPAPVIQLDYDLGLSTSNQYQVRATLAGGGSSSAEYLACLVDFNGDGVVDNGDIGFFITLFLEGSPAADLTGDGVVDNGDISAFISAFLAGC